MATKDAAAEIQKSMSYLGESEMALNISSTTLLNIKNK